MLISLNLCSLPYLSFRLSSRLPTVLSAAQRQQSFYVIFLIERQTALIWRYLVTGLSGCYSSSSLSDHNKIRLPQLWHCRPAFWATPAVELLSAGETRFPERSHPDWPLETGIETVWAISPMSRRGHADAQASIVSLFKAAWMGGVWSRSEKGITSCIPPWGPTGANNGTFSEPYRSKNSTLSPFHRCRTMRCKLSGNNHSYHLHGGPGVTRAAQRGNVIRQIKAFGSVSPNPARRNVGLCTDQELFIFASL